MDSLPWPAITAASGGWVLLTAVLWRVYSRLLSGDLLTRREADAMKDENVSLRAANSELLAQNGLMLREQWPAQSALMNALRRAAEDAP